MALFPCVRGPHTFRGKASSVYVGLLADGVDADRWKLRFCGSHLLEFNQDLAQFKVTIENDAVRANGSLDTCLACLKPAGEVDWQLFVTVYPANQEREDYWGKLHVDCRVPAYLTRG
jgi:hypothetical protein